MGLNLKEFQNWVINNEGVIMSDGTLNLEHLLPKAFDILVSFSLNEKLQREILSVFEYDENDVFIIGLFEQQYFDNARLKYDMLEEASWTWNESVFNYFNEIAPDGYSFGSSEGDGALIGWFKFNVCKECGHETDEDELTLYNGVCEACVDEE